ncbi:MAG TPA: phosphoglucosamine mutase [Phycisphaerales bacterium]|nr:phosphoglucosamine mutase [Phycisphaerales bacterium]
MTNPPLMLSVSGARGIVGETMTPEIAYAFASAFASLLHERLGKLPSLCVARDSRPSGPELQSAVADAFVSSGCAVTDLGVIATPTAGVMIHALRADGGVVVTASHNPTPWNGIKCLDGDGLAPCVEDAQEIIRRFHAGTMLDKCGGGSIEVNTLGNDTHIAKLLGVIDPTPMKDRLFRVVLDSINGAGCVSGFKLLEHLGCEILHLNGEPTGDFAHTPEPKKENLGDLCEAVKNFNADVGFAQDPDGDRLAIVDESGRYLGEEYTLALAALRWLEQHPNSSTAANLSTSRMIDDIASSLGCTTFRSPVGEANVAGAMKEHRCIIGGEGNGGVIFPRVCWVRDSLVAIMLTLDLMCDRGTALSSIVNGLPAYKMVKRAIDLRELGGHDVITAEIERLKEAHASEQLDDRDGLRIDFEEGWVHLRSSNTEPIARVIAEAGDEVTANGLADKVRL